MKLGSAFRQALMLTTTLGVAVPAIAEAQDGTSPFPIPTAMSATEPLRVDYTDFISQGAFDSYGEPDWVAALVADGKLPPVEDRLPPQPYVMNLAATPDGVGEYGGVFRHVTGGRPEGWNWPAGLHQGWGGLTMLAQECLLKTGPIFQLTEERIDPIPNLVTSWQWSDDGKQLTMNLIEGARWSDGDPFDAEDMMFFWDHNVLDTNVNSTMQASAFGDGTTLERIDDFTVKFTFPEQFPVANLFKMAYRNFCPGPSHILKPMHPAFNSDATYDSYLNGLPADELPWVTMGPWVPVEFEPDQIVVARRNPYYWKVDDQGNQLPYLDEMQFKLSTWEDRTIQTVAGTADMTNMENPSIFLESLRSSQDDDFPAQIFWGPRSLHWRIDMNLSSVCGLETDRDRAIRDLNRNVTFRKAVTHGIDRVAIGQALVRGPFTHPHAGGLHPETEFFSPDMVAFYDFDQDRSRALLAEAGFEDTDGDGIVNWSDGPLAGENLDIVLTYSTTRTTDVSLSESAITLLREVGINVIPNALPQPVQQVRDTCAWDWIVERGDREYQAPLANLDNLAPITAKNPEWHQGTADSPQDLLDFERELVDLVTALRTEPDPEARNEMLRTYNRIFTENVYNVGLITSPAALLMHKRLRNVPPGTPVLAFQWSENAMSRERLWVPAAERLDIELRPGVLPGVN